MSCLVTVVVDNSSSRVCEPVWAEDCALLRGEVLGMSCELLALHVSHDPWQAFAAVLRASDERIATHLVRKLEEASLVSSVHVAVAAQVWEVSGV